MSKGNVLLIGLNPAVVDYAKYPGLNPEKLESVLRSDESRLQELGYNASMCFIDHGETAEATLRTELSRNSFACILIGAGVRKDPDEFILFEEAVNIVHRLAPDAHICFNTGPTDSVEAVQRWL